MKFETTSNRLSFLPKMGLEFFLRLAKKLYSNKGKQGGKRVKYRYIFGHQTRFQNSYKKRPRSAKVIISPLVFKAPIPTQATVEYSASTQHKVVFEVFELFTV